jgi:hypothetical protein
MEHSNKEVHEMTLIPAYGRDYKSGKAAKADWEAGKDFQICDLFSGEDGRYVTKAELPEGSAHRIRYKRLTQICVVKA